MVGPINNPVVVDDDADDVHVFPTGAVRGTDADDVRYDLITPIGLEAVARTCAEGAKKYGDFNWEKGMAVDQLLNHALRHIYRFLFGDRSEDHLAHAAWNVLAAIHSLDAWPDLNKGLRPERDRQPTQTQGGCWL